ncbi:putative beta-primeverosidase [Rosa chinensis]|uniref:Putative beta-primeverosidase n=1 Tax=Rosa chinensis TaxID=74649 RepID=A0A2P6QM52_ROSCH|nr:putative beta-primeverosidase [Rosa chinensis]
MKNMGFEFSLSLSRLLPNKTFKSITSPPCLRPFVTLFHWDLPQALEGEYDGFLSPQIVYASRNLVIELRTGTSPGTTYANGGYVIGTFAPCQSFEWHCTSGNSGTEPYFVSHYQLLAHAAAVKLYKEKYREMWVGGGSWETEEVGGFGEMYRDGLESKPIQPNPCAALVIAITILSHWFVPFSDAKHHEEAAIRALDFMFGWYVTIFKYQLIKVCAHTFHIPCGIWKVLV